MEIAYLGKLFRDALLAGLILLDGTPAFRAPGDKSAVARYDTGDRVQIVQERTVGERFYEVKRGSETVFVPARAVFVTGTRQSADSLPLDFYRRSSKNRNGEARALGAGGLVRLLKGRELLAAWRKFQRDPSDEVRCAANESFSRSVVAGEPRFHADLTEALLRVRRDGGWGEDALCGLGEVLSRSSHPDKEALRVLLAERGLRGRPSRDSGQGGARARELLKRGLKHPEAWVRQNLISQVCQNEHVSDGAVAVLTELFASMSPDDKAQVIENDGGLEEKASARPLLLQIRELIGDKSQPTRLRMLAATDSSLKREEKRPAIDKVMGDPRDELRLELAAQLCRSRDVLEDAANHGDDAAFAGALMCLDRQQARRTGPYAFDAGYHPEGKFSDWLAPDLATGLESIGEPARREQVERRLKCLLGQSLCPASLYEGLTGRLSWSKLN